MLYRNCWLGFILVWITGVASVSHPEIDVSLKASWNSGPYILELLESAAKEEPESYFELLDAITNGSFDDVSSDEETFNRFLQVTHESKILRTPEAESLFNLSMSLRAASPVIEAHYHYYRETLEAEIGGHYNKDCTVWVHFDNKQLCEVEEIRKAIKLAMDKAHCGLSKSVTELPYDRILGLSGLPVAVAYVSDIKSKKFREIHGLLSFAAANSALNYRVRYMPIANFKSENVLLSGYGVELVLKKTDYIVMDDRKVVDSKTTEIKPDESQEDVESKDIAPLHPDDIPSLGMKTASYVMKSKNPLSTLNKVLGDYPKYGATLAATQIDENFQKEYDLNRDIWLGGGENGIWINGQILDPQDITAFGVLDHMRGERQLIESIKDLGLSTDEAVKLIMHPLILKENEQNEPQRFDWRDKYNGGNVILWLNDLENDSRYENWPSDAETILRQVYPGQLHSVRINVYHLIFPIDLSNAQDIAYIDQLSMYVSRRVALRIGLVPIVKSELARNQAKMLYHLVDTYGRRTAFSYFREVAKSTAANVLSQTALEEVLKEATLRKDKDHLTIEEIMASKDLEERLKDTKEYGKRLDLGTTPPPLFVNGIAIPRSSNWVHTMSQILSGDVTKAQQLTMKYGYKDIDFVELFLDGSAQKRNFYIFPEEGEDVDILNVANVLKKHGELVKKLPYIKGKTATEHTTSTADLWIVGDFDDEDGYNLLRSAVSYQSNSPNINIIAVHNPQKYPKSPMLSTLIHQLNDKGVLNSEVFQKVVEEQTPEKGYKDLPHVESVPEGFQHRAKTEGWAVPDIIAAENYWISCHEVVKDLKFLEGEKGIIVNGRIVGPIPKGVPFEEDDFTELLLFEINRRIEPALEAVRDLGKLDILEKPYAVGKVVSLLNMKPEIKSSVFGREPPARMTKYESFREEYSAIKVGEEKDATFKIIVVIDPACERAQKWMSIIEVLSKLKGVYLKVFLNPIKATDELPVKRFYRYVLHPSPQFENGSLLRPRASFKGIPQNALLTLGMDVPPSWLVAPKECVHDLDNIKLSAFTSRFGTADVSAMYELRNILIEGHSRDMSQGGQPPSGTQLVLGTKKHRHYVDTIIMANLGYFQFKANPGFWNMELMDGRSKRVYNIESAGTKGFIYQPGDEKPEITLMSFKGATLYPRLRRNKGMEEEDVLQAEEDNTTLGKAKKYADGFLSKMGMKTTETKQADINIFSVASGHLYERFLSIMILSVMKHTKKTVKFWFIENFLSPSFKNFIPVLSAEYNFQYELVTYKWPHWLRAQKEKQREIWGYKILFLDVLFPLDLDKVIFVDADQIVRTDMHELVTLDLHGAPYGFTPMCDSRTEIEGFRFWKTGYWASFLRGKKYHISALYVIDLTRFRALAAGDRLRQQYHQLSADPNSLANLDQDLPNHMQMQIPIFSLPQEWLWCETWCSDESLKDAKTIDLCNNPMTKEPKLDRARRQVPEWNAYDEEVAKLAERERKSGGEGVGYMREAVVQKEALGEKHDEL